jgi:hypothetical protein
VLPPSASPVEEVDSPREQIVSSDGDIWLKRAEHFLARGMNEAEWSQQMKMTNQCLSEDLTLV